MNFSVLYTSLRNEPILIVLLAIFFLFSLLSALTYFHVARPQSGTIEWITRRRGKKWDTPKPYLPRPADFVWLLLALALSALLRMVRIFCFLDLYAFSTQSYNDLITAAFSESMIPTLALAAACFLLLRIVYGQPLVAVLGAVLGAFTHSYELWATTFVVLSLMFVYLWSTAEPDAPLFFNAFWLMFAGVCYGVALLTCWATIYLAPMYLTVYCLIQVYRWRKGDPERRLAKLIGSVFLLCAVVLFGTFLLWLIYYLSDQGKVHILTILTSEELYSQMFPTLMQKFRDLFERPGLRATFLAADSFLLLLGLSSVLPALYAFVKERKLIALVAICSLGFFVLLWIVGCVYMLMPALLLLIGWTWKTFAERGYVRYAVFSCLAVVICYIAELLLR